MQDTEAFLRLVLPAEGIKFLAIPNDSGHGFSHTAFTDLEDMAASATDWSLDGYNVYYALSGFAQPYVETIENGQRKRRMRTQDNVSFVRSLWVDLDVGDEDRKYSSQQEAVVDVIRFTKAAGLPTPVLVNSGGGVHAYWPMDQDVPRAGWKKLATMFKQVTIALGLKADPVRTADEASVLRLPGTVNRKPGRGERPVALIGPLRAATPVVEMARMVKAAFDGCGATMPRIATPAAPIHGINSDLLMPQEHKPANLDRIIARCPQVAEVAGLRGCVEEPRWYATLQLVRHCEDGPALAHTVSDGYPGYSATATDKKVQQLIQRGVGPTTCDRFASLKPGVCDSCPHFGAITSPVQLGREEEEIPPGPPAEVELDGVTIELPEAPWPYFRTQAHQVAMMLEDDDADEPQPVVIYKYDLYPVARHYDEYERRFHTKFRTYQPKRGWYEFDLPNDVLYDGKALAKALANNDVLPSMNMLKHLGGYIVSYVQRLQELASHTDLFMQMGWRDNDTKFILGTQMVTPTGVATAPASAITGKATEKFDSAGSLDEWKDIVSFYSEPNMEPLMFGFLSGFGAPLFKFTGFNGVILNMMGASGTGKSTVLRAMNSIYGRQDCAFFQLMDTDKSFYRRVGVLNNLPVAFDEITNINNQRLSDLCYDFTQGRERMRLTQQATERRDTFHWQTIMVSSANASLHSRLASLKGDASAESVRVFEYNVPKHDSFDALSVKRRFDKLNEHYGLAGVLYMRHVVDNLAEIRGMIDRLTDNIYTEAKLPSSERFWAALIACNITGGIVADKLGIIQFDAKRMLKWCYARIDEMRGVVKEYQRSPIETISDWLASLVPHTLVITGTPNRPNLPTHALLPKGEIRVRYDSTTGYAYIPQSVIQELCNKHNVDQSMLRRELSEIGVMTGSEKRVLSAGTEFKTGKTTVWALNLRNALMDDLTEQITGGADKEKVVRLDGRGRPA